MMKREHIKREIKILEIKYKALRYMNGDDAKTWEYLVDKRINLLQQLALKRKKLIAILSQNNDSY